MKTENTNPTATEITPRNIIVAESPLELEFFQAGTGAVYLVQDREDREVAAMVGEGFADPTPQFVILACNRAYDVWSYGKEKNMNETVALYRLTDKMAKHMYAESGKDYPAGLEVWVLVSWAFIIKSNKDLTLESFIGKQSRNAQICGESFNLPIAASVSFLKTPFKNKENGQTIPAHKAVWKREELPHWVGDWVKTLDTNTWLSRYAPDADLDPRKVSTPLLYERQQKALQGAKTQHVVNGEATTLDAF